MILTVTALLPVFVILAFVYWKDPKKEPFGTIAKVFGLGVLTVIPAAILEEVLEIFISGEENPFISNFFCVALTEEAVKLAVLLLFIFRHQDFDDTFDGIVYAVSASLGFAAAENLMYTFESGLDVGLMRAVTSIPGHASFAVVMGYFLPKAKTSHFYQRISKRNKYILLALLVPTMVHGLYDYLITISEIEMFLCLIVLIDIISIVTIIKASRNDKSVMIDDEEKKINQV